MRGCSTLSCPLPLPGMDGSYLILCGFHGWPVLREDHGQGKEKHEQSVTHVTKHHSEEKGEGDDGIRSCRQTGDSQADSHRGAGQDLSRACS